MKKAYLSKGDKSMKAAIQLYSVRQNMSKDPLSTVRKVVETGYRYLEAANHASDQDPGVGFAAPASKMKEILEDLGAKVIGAHVMPLTPQGLPSVLEYHHQIGTKYIVCPIAFYRNLDEVKAAAEPLNRMGEMCSAAGMRMLYHNHYHEFQHFGDQTVFDTLAEYLEPELVNFEIDTYWTMRAGQDPTALLKRLGRRVCLIHQKDFTKGYESEINLLASAEESGDYIDFERFGRDMREVTFAEIGAGIMDIQSIIQTGNEVCEAEYIVLEQDYSQLGEFESIKISRDNLKKYSGVQWE
jgi:sugar phosphate isomerase/epimerase